MNTDKLTVDQAEIKVLELLENEKEIRLKDLESIVKSLSIENPLISKSAITYLYSGLTGGMTANDIVQEISKQQGSMARIINNTDVAKFLDGEIYKQAVRFALQNENPKLVRPENTTLLDETIDDYLYNETVGQWAKTSKRFIESTSGDIICLVSEADPGRVWWLTEMPAILKNPAITSINGIAKSEIFTYMDALKSVSGFTESQAAAAVNELIVARSYLDICKIYQYMDEFGKIHLDFSAITGVDNPNIPKGATEIALTDYIRHVKKGDMTALEAFMKYGEINPSSTIKDSKQWVEFVNTFSKEEAITQFPNLYKLSNQNSFVNLMGKLGKVGSVVGPIVIGIDAIVTLQTAQKMYEETGDITESVKLCTGWALGIKSGMAAAGMAMEACMPLAMALAATGPWGILGAALLELGAGAVGFMAGDAFGKWLNENIWTFGEGVGNVVLDFLGISNAQKVAVRVDPLILDLNGDGRFTDKLTNNMHFDFGGDGFSENTGWATSSDGFLVRDLNNNGVYHKISKKLFYLNKEMCLDLEGL